MYSKKNKFLILLLLLFTTTTLFGQRVTNSPYSRYGIGDIYTLGFGHNIAKGGTSIADCSPMYLNSSNPAGITSLQMQRFIFDVGMDTKYTTLSSNSTSQKNCNTAFKYLAGGFAAKPWWYFMFMLNPYSSVGYSMKDTTLISFDNKQYGYYQEIEGEGGLSKISLSTSFKFLDMISVGVTGGFLFGSLDRSQRIDNIQTDNYTTSIKYQNRYFLSGFQYDLGFLFSKSIKSKKDSTKNSFKFNIGAVLGNEAKLNSRNELFLAKYNNLEAISDTICNDTLADGSITIPKKIGIGVSVELFEKLTILADYTQQDWSNFSIEGENNTKLKNSTKMSFGMQYVQDKYSSRFLRQLMYRFGCHSENTYLELNGQSIKDQGVTFGIGVPIHSIILNVGCDLGKRGTTNNNLYQEKYFLLHFNVTIHDIWFVKRKFQ
ncbi:MAG: hypothetical protein MJ211_01100 [Bacteroidales bacterium]|nr:hypothetical protein [Bacteroidales bacterium]